MKHWLLNRGYNWSCNLHLLLESLECSSLHHFSSGTAQEYCSAHSAAEDRTEEGDHEWSDAAVIVVVKVNRTSPSTGNGYGSGAVGLLCILNHILDFLLFLAEEGHNCLSLLSRSTFLITGEFQCQCIIFSSHGLYCGSVAVVRYISIFINNTQCGSWVADCAVHGSTKTPVPCNVLSVGGWLTVGEDTAFGL